VSTWVDAMDQPLWDYDSDGALTHPNDVAGASGVSELIGTPEEGFAFNPNQRRGPDGRWIKMGGGLPGAAPIPRPFDTDPNRSPVLLDGSTGLKEGKAAWATAQRPEQAAEWVEVEDRRLAKQIPHAAVYYTSDGYRDLNRNLRRNDPVREEEEEYVQALDAAMAESAMRGEIVTYRGVYDGEGMFSPEAMQGSLVGAEWDDPAYVSTSARPEFIESFARPGWPNAVAMRMLLPWGTQALRLGEWGQEAEVLLGRGNRYKVTADYGVVDGVRRIDVEVVQGEPLPKYRRADANRRDYY